MKYSAKVNVKGKTYSIAFTPATGAVYCVNCGTLRTITAAKTLATIYAAWADQDHAEALEMNAVHDSLDMKSRIDQYNGTGLYAYADSFGQYWKSVGGDYEGAKFDYEEMQAEALVDDANYQGAIKIIADHLTLPVWDGCSETVKREVVKTHHTEALEINESLHPAPVTLFNIWQRSDGMQLAVNADGTAVYMRPFKQAAWLRAGFEANLEYYWLVEKGVAINETPKLTVYYDDGILNTVEAI